MSKTAVKATDFGIFAAGMLATVTGIISRGVGVENVRDALEKILVNSSPEQIEYLTWFSGDRLPHYGLVPALTPVVEPLTKRTLEKILGNKAGAFSEWMVNHPREVTAITIWIGTVIMEPLQTLTNLGGFETGDIIADTVGLVAMFALPKIVEAIDKFRTGEMSLHQIKEDLQHTKEKVGCFLRERLLKEKCLCSETIALSEGREPMQHP